VKGESKMKKLIVYLLFALGILLTLMSISYGQMIMAFVGLGLTFWGGILFYISSSRYVPLELLNAIAASTLTNIDNIILDSNPTGKGVYLPPKYLKDFESSLVFIPARANQSLPEPTGNFEALYSRNPYGAFITPPGLALSKLFEKKLGVTFTRTDLNYLQSNLPKLLIEDLEIAEDTDIRIKNNILTVTLKNHVFNEVCQETRKNQKIHESIGCMLSSGIACALAKATGKPIIIDKEENNGGTTKIQYRILEA
jgi:hypothetical protein